MPEITFQCPKCNQKLEAPAEMAGEVIECPSCQSEITIPADKTRKDLDLTDIAIGGEVVEEDQPQQASGEAEDSSTTGNICPNCNEPMDPGAVLCVKCGYHQKMGKVIETDLS